MASVRGPHAAAAAMAARIARMLDKDNEDAEGVPVYVEEAETRQGVAIHRGRGDDQARGIARPSHVRAPEPPAYTCATPARRASPLQPPEGFRHNIGEQFIPFNITDEHRRPMPARFVQVNLTADPYILGRLTLASPTYRSELHVTPIDGEEPPQCLTDNAIHMFDCDYPAADLVNVVVQRIGDLTLEGEIMRRRSTMARLEVNQTHLRCLQREQERIQLDLDMGRHRLQEARACNRVLDDMISDQRIRREVRRGCGRGHPA